MNLQIFSFAYIFLISPPIFELLHLSMVLTYRNVTPHLGNLRGRILTHIMIEIINIMAEYSATVIQNRSDRVLCLGGILLVWQSTLSDWFYTSVAEWYSLT